jgi:translation initiation factor IF-3
VPWCAIISSFASASRRKQEQGLDGNTNCRNEWRRENESAGEEFIAISSVRVNERIRAREIRVIDDSGTQLGIMQPFQAMKIAREQSLDLVEISPTAVPPVCKIMDYGKYIYQMSKRAHDAKKSQRNIILKEVKFRPNTDEHDYEFKKNNILRFLKEGDKVKAVVTFRGREISHSDIGRRMLERLIEDVAEAGMVEFRPRMEGFSIHAIFAPKK